jgi:tyrosinase
MGAFLLPSGNLRSQPSAGNLRVRRSALDLPANDDAFKKYGEAVKKMHELPATDRRNWRRMAETHADFCQHETSGFLPWHRHYITRFEAVCGQLIGDSKFALPYWDWTKKDGKIPDPFFDINELNVAFWNDNGVYNGAAWGPVDTVPIRAIGKGFGMQSDPLRGGAFTPDRIQSILDETAFDDFTGRLEGTPHNTGHVVVGFPPKGKAGHMGSGLSPLDPLFWLHHCNVDRIWALWQVAGNPTPAFTGEYKKHFVDVQGMDVDVNIDDARDFRAMGFTYDDFGDPVPLLMAANVIAQEQNFLNNFRIAPVSNPTAILGTADRAVAKVGIPKTITVPVKNLKQSLDESRQLKSRDFPKWAGLKQAEWDKDALKEYGRPKETPRRIQAVLTNVRTTAAVPPLVNVFLSCPYLSDTTPYTDNHYVGTFSFFGAASPAAGGAGHKAEHAAGHGAGHAGKTVIVDLTRAIRYLGLTKNEALKVQLMPLGTDGEVTFDKIEIRTS